MNALNNAANASSFFAMLANDANILAGVLAGIGALIALAAIWQPELWPLVAMVATASAAFWELGAKAGELSRSFNDMTRNGASWFTHGNIEAQMGKVLAIGAGFTGLTSGGWGASGFALIKKIANAAGQQIVTKVTITGVVIDLGGSIALGSMAESDLAQENGMVLT